MITSKKDLKKHIDRINAEVAERVLPEAILTNAIDEEKAGEVLVELAKLTAEAHSRLNIAFDKSADAFATPSEYAKARKAYFRAAYDKALADYQNSVNALLQGIRQK